MEVYGFRLPMDVLSVLLIIVALIVCDVLMGIVLGIKEGTFSFQKLPSFLKQNIFPYLGGLLVLGVFSVTNPEIRLIYFASVAATTIKFLADLKDKAIAIFGPGVRGPGQ